MKRIIALDFGTKRTGVAVTDPMQIIASGLDTVLTPDLISFLKSYMVSEPVSTIVLGEPKQMDNTPSESEAAIGAFILTLEAEFPDIEIARPEVFCGLDWWNCKDSYYNDNYKTKYAVEPKTNEWLVANACGIHLWNNFTYNKHDIDFSTTHPQSLYNILYNIIFN